MRERAAIIVALDLTGVDELEIGLRALKAALSFAQLGVVLFSNACIRRMRF